MFVEAGAGAGKTSIIVARIVNQLKAGITPESIVAITFTNAATHELKKRIIASARQASTDSRLNPNEAENLKKSLEMIDQMHISTIHSFCYSILSERSLDAKIIPGAILLEESEVERAKELRFMRWAEGLNRSDWSELLKAARYKSEALKMLKSLTFQLIDMPDDMNIKVGLDDVTLEEIIDKTQGFVDNVLANIYTIASELNNENYTSIEEVSDELLSKYGQLIKYSCKSYSNKECNIVDVLKRILSLPNTSKFSVNITAKKIKEVYSKLKKDEQEALVEALKKKDDALREYIEMNSQAITELIGGYENSIYRPYVKYAQKAKSYYNEHFPVERLSNDMLIKRTSELVNSSVESRRFFAKKYQCIYVDEFQDTDHVQEDFIWKLAEDVDNPGSLRDGALFVVGDPKQSIYRFRGAEPRVYFETKNKMLLLDNAYVLELSFNFRSNNKIIDWVNSEFRSKDITDGNPYVPMEITKNLPNGNLSPNVIAGVYKYINPMDAENKNNIYNDILATVRLIHNLVHLDYCIPRFGSDGKFASYDGIKYSDFLILCMNTVGMEEYARVFREFDIPCVMDSKVDISANESLSYVIKMYAFMVNPYDRVCRMGAKEVLYNTGIKDRDEEERIINVIQSQTSKMSADGCLGYIIDHLDLILPKAQEEEQVEIADCDYRDLVTMITQMFESVMAAGHRNKQEVLSRLKDYLEKKVEHTLVLEENIDAVRFMNLHKSKGLEGNIVIWTNRIENKEFKEGSYSSERDFYPSIVVDYNGGKTLKWSGCNKSSEILDAAKREDISERIRLEYVAATRAKQALIFMDRYNAKSGNLFTDGYSLDLLESVKDIVDAGKAVQTAKITRDYDYDGGTKSEKELTAKLKQPLYLSESPSDYEIESAGKSKMGEAVKGKMIRPKGNVFGTTMHRAFELIMKRFFGDIKEVPEGLGSASLLDATIRQAINENRAGIPKTEINNYFEFLKEAALSFGSWFNTSSIRKEAATIYTELPFSTFKTRKSDDIDSPVWLHGSADLVIVNKNGSVIIIDYKSDNDESYNTEADFEARLKGKYSPQIEAYKDAVSMSLNVNRDRITGILISFSQKELDSNSKLRLRQTYID